MRHGLIHAGWPINWIRSIRKSPAPFGTRPQSELVISTEDRFYKLKDLDIDTICEIVPVIPDEDPKKPAWLRLLAILVLQCHDLLLKDMGHDRAILVLNDAVKLTPGGNREKTARLTRLGRSLFSPFKRSRDVDINNMSPDGHPDTPSSRLNNLGSSLLSHFLHHGDIADVDGAISACNDAVRLTPDGHLDKPSYLDTLGNSLFTRFERLGDIADVDQAISVYGDAVQLLPDGHPEKPVILNNLGNAFCSRFLRLRDIVDVDKAISAYNDALRLTPDDDPGTLSTFNNLGNALVSRFQRLGDLVDIENAISAYENVVRQTPNNHSDMPSYLNNLGICLLSRFKRFGVTLDIEKAIFTCENAVKLTPDGHPDKPGFLSIRGNTLLNRFRRFGQIVDIDNAISAYNDAVRLSPDRHPSTPAYLNDLGNCLLGRFKRLGDFVDVDKAISAYNDALKLIPDDHADMPSYLNNLGNAFLIRFERLREIADVEKAISTYKDALLRTPDGHPGKPGLLNNLGNSIVSRFKHLGDIVDVEEAISVCKDAVKQAPDDHPDKPTLLNNLSSCLLRRFERLGAIIDVDEAISAQNDAVRLTPDSHPNKPGRLISLGHLFLSRFRSLGDVADMERATLEFSSAARSSVGPTLARFDAALRWAHCASEISSSSSLIPYHCALDLLPRVAWLGLTITERHRELTDIGDIVREAAAAAISSGEFNTALEWLEQGRSIVWGQLLQLRSPVDDLHAMDDDLASRLEQISKELEHSSTRDTLVQLHSHLSLEGAGQRHRQLAVEWDTLVEKARALPGFEGFLLPKTVSQLKEAARAGPVVLINVHTTRCDALVLRAEVDDVIHIPLDDFSDDKGQALQKSLNKILSANKLRIRESRITVLDTQPSIGDGDNTFKEILSELWLHIVKPVLDCLAYSVAQTPDPPRIWWCATGSLTFLPIHAAGLYDIEGPGSEVGDYVTSSYTPTLTALLDAPRGSRLGEFQMLAIAQPLTPGHSPLPNTTEELIRIRRHAGRLPVMSLEGSQATVASVFKGMMESGWLHLACHGVQHPADPTKSALLLHDGRLELKEVIKMPLPHAEFAFLSACQTATGDEQLSEEAVHLAAGMLLAGYRGVIATTWSIKDEDAPFIADKVYACMLENHQPDRTRAAHALQHAVQQLRKREGMSFLRWVPFIHIGM